MKRKRNPPASPLKAANCATRERSRPMQRSRFAPASTASRCGTTLSTFLGRPSWSSLPSLGSHGIQCSSSSEGTSGERRPSWSNSTSLGASTSTKKYKQSLHTFRSRPLGVLLDQPRLLESYHLLMHISRSRNVRTDKSRRLVLTSQFFVVEKTLVSRSDL